MLLACVIAIVAVALGLGLGLAPAGRARIAGPLRTFALSAALTVVLLHLLPEALSELGVVALCLFAATSAFPAWVRLGRALFGLRVESEGLAHGGLAAGYVGLLVHHVGDGLGLGAYATLPGGADEHADVMLALAAHTVPLVAVVAFAFQRIGGSRRALAAAAGLAFASVFGVLLSGALPDDALERYSAWVAALVAGLLIHVVTHDLERDLPTTLGGRGLDALAAVAGVATSLVGGEHAGENHLNAIASVAAALQTVAPPVLVGSLLATLAIRATRRPLPSVLGAAYGSNLAIDGAVLAFWIGGAAWGVLFVAGVAALTRVVAVVSPKLANADATAPSDAPFLIRFDDVLSESLPWIFSAFALWVLLASSFPARELDAYSAPVAIACAALVAIPIRIPPAAAVLVAIALERAGLRFEAALVFAVLAPLPGAVEVTRLTRGKARRAASRLVLWATFSALALGMLAAIVLGVADAFHTPFVPQFSSQVALLFLAVLALRAAFDRGLRGFLLQIFPSHDTASHASELSTHSDAPATPGESAESGAS